MGFPNTKWNKRGSKQELCVDIYFKCSNLTSKLFNENSLNFDGKSLHLKFDIEFESLTNFKWLFNMIYLQLMTLRNNAVIQGC